MPTVFISYCRERVDKARALAKDLEDLGYQTWFDQDLTGGQSWWNLILEEIRKCSIFAYVLDGESLESAACKAEFKYALELQKHILPIVVAAGIIPEHLHPDLAGIQSVDYFQGSEPWRGLARALSKLPPPNPLPDPLPKAPSAPVSHLGTLRERVEAPSLSGDDQAVLLFSLKRTLREPTNVEGVRELLIKFRSRDDLLVPVSEEIDELLAKAPSPPPPPGPDPPLPPAPSPPRPKLRVLLDRLIGPPRGVQSTENLSQVLSLKQIWISAVCGILISAVLNRLMYFELSTVWILLHPTWSLPASLLLFITVVWRMLSFRPPALRIALILLPAYVGLMIPTVLRHGVGAGSFDWEAPIAGAVIAVLIVVIVFWTDNVTNPSSLKSAAISVAGGLACLVVLCLFGGRNYLVVILSWMLAAIFLLYPGFILVRVLARKLD